MRLDRDWVARNVRGVQLKHSMRMAIGVAKLRFVLKMHGVTSNGHKPQVVSLVLVLACSKNATCCINRLQAHRLPRGRMRPCRNTL